MGLKNELPSSVKKAFGHFFEMGAEAQDIAVTLIEEAAIERGRNFPKRKFLSRAEREATERRWNEYVSRQGDKLATQLDPSYWPGHTGNIEPVVVTRSHFLKIFDDQTDETLLQTKELIEKTLGK